MDVLLLIKAAILGIVEGLTEFLPISSTGHLILASSLLNFNDERGKLFEIVIQSGAILAICWVYRQKFAFMFTAFTPDRGLLPEQVQAKQHARQFTYNLAIAFVPLAVLGLLFGKYIKAVLFNPTTVALAFIVGGLIILWAEHRQQPTVRVSQADDITWQDAIKLGFAQALALIPGMSRSGSTIIGGLFFGLSRRAATEFSFFLAVPTLVIASIYQLYKERALLAIDDWAMWVVGLSFAFASAFICVRWLLRYVSSHDFTWFAWYRIAFGGFILCSHNLGWVNWAH